LIEATHQIAQLPPRPTPQSYPQRGDARRGFPEVSRSRKSARRARSRRHRW